MPITLTCRNCRLVFKRPPSQSHAQYCSAKCWYAFAKGKGITGKITIREKTCKSCGKTFKARPTSYFCSRACINKGRISPKRVARVPMACRVCGASFSRLQCQIGSGRGKFCSKTCRAIHSNAVQVRDRSSGIEKRFFNDCRRLGIALEPQVKIGQYSIDAMAADGKTAFEFDGTYWHSSPAAVLRDLRKDAYLQRRGIDVVRIPEALYRTNPSAAINLVVASQYGGRP